MLAARPEVATVEADRPIELPEPSPAPAAAPATVEWNIAAVNAPAVWDDLSLRGKGIVVGNLDTGVQFDHPRAVGQYRLLAPTDLKGENPRPDLRPNVVNAGAMATFSSRGSATGLVKPDITAPGEGVPAPSPAAATTP